MDLGTSAVTDPSEAKKKVLEEITNKNLGSKRYHSETSLQQYEENEDDVFEDRGEKDPGVRKAIILIILWLVSQSVSEW